MQLLPQRRSRPLTTCRLDFSEPLSGKCRTTRRRPTVRGDGHPSARLGPWRPGHLELRELGRDLVKASYLKGDFVLRSGKRSNRYFDKFLFETDPALLRSLGKHLAALVPTDTQRLAAPELGAVLLGGAVSMETGLPLVLVRKEPKGYGTSKQIEGRFGQATGSR